MSNQTPEKNKTSKKKNKETLLRVLGYIKPYMLFVVLSLLCAAISVAAQLLVPIYCGNAIDYMIGKGAVDMVSIQKIVGSIIIATAVTAIVQWILASCNNRITFCVSRDLRNDAIEKIQKLPLSYLDGHASGDLVSRVVADVDTFADGLLMGFTQLFTGVLTILGTLGFYAIGEPWYYPSGGLLNSLEFVCGKVYCQSHL